MSEPNLTPEQNAVAFYRNRSLAFQALAEITRDRLREMVEVLNKGIDAVYQTDKQFQVELPDPMTQMFDNIRRVRPELKDKTDQELSRLLTDNPDILNR